MDYKKRIGSKIRELRKEKGLDAKDLAKAFNVSNGTVTAWEKGERKFDLDLLEEFADFFNVSLYQFLENNGNADAATVNRDMVEVPIIGEVRAGYNLLADENIVGYNIVPRSALNGGEYFSLYVTGDSMRDAQIQEGDLLLVRKQSGADNGQIVVAMTVDEEVTVKRLYYDRKDRIILQAENEKFPPRTYDEGEIRILGVVKQRTSNVR